MIFQDPFGSLNPVKTSGTTSHGRSRSTASSPIARSTARVHELLETVGLVPPERIAAKYPHELSGGQRQRVAIARALAVEPTVIIADEPTSMLDVSIRIGILNLILELKERRGLAFLYVTHDLASARYVADDVLVMYAGQIVEHGPVEDVLQSPLHPYTRLLLSAVPNPAAAGEQVRVRQGTGLAAAVDPTAGCRFVERCPLAIGVCSAGHARACRRRPRAKRPLPRHRTVHRHSRGRVCRIKEVVRFRPTSSGAPRRRRTRSRARPTKTAAARASGIASARRPARSGSATTAPSRATSTTATAKTSP